MIGAFNRGRHHWLVVACAQRYACNDCFTVTVWVIVNGRLRLPAHLSRYKSATVSHYEKDAASHFVTMPPMCLR